MEKLNNKEKIESLLKYRVSQDIPADLWDFLCEFIFLSEKTITNTFGDLDEMVENFLLRLFVEKADKNLLEKFIVDHPPVFNERHGYHAYFKAQIRYISYFEHTNEDVAVLFAIMRDNHRYVLWHATHVSHTGKDACDEYISLATKEEIYKLLFMQDFLYCEEIYLESFQKISGSLSEKELREVREKTFSKKLFEKVTELLNQKNKKNEKIK